MKIVKDVLKNKNIRAFFGFMVVTNAIKSIFGQVGKIYLTNDLGYSKENLSFVDVVCTPLNIVFAVYSGYLSNQSPFRYLYFVIILNCAFSVYAVFGLLGTMPTDPQ